MTIITKYFDPGSRSPRKTILLKGSKSFVAQIEKLMRDWIYYSYTGRAVLEEIHGSPTRLQLTVDYSPGQQYAEAVDDPSTAVDERKDAWAPDVGTGVGASSVLIFDTNTTVPRRFCNHDICPTRGFVLPKFVLFHELVHSMRHVKGKWRRDTVTMNRQTVKLEEAIAITICNILMSEKGENELRADHVSLDTFGPDPFSYVKDYSIQVIADTVRVEHPKLYTTIVDLQQTYFPFNPFYAREQTRSA